MTSESGPVPKDDYLLIRVRDPDDDREEVLEVFGCEHRTWEFGPDKGTNYTLIQGIDPYDSELLPSSLAWFSGSFADSRSDDMRRFPCVYVPADVRFEVSIIDESEDEVNDGH